MVIGAGSQVQAVAPPDRKAQAYESAELIQLLRVKTPTAADKLRLTTLDLDLAESAGKDFVDLVAYGNQDRRLLQLAGFSCGGHLAQWAYGVPAIGRLHERPGVEKSRVIIVPVVNPDGFNLSRTLGYEMKRKNCRVTNGQIPTTGQCALSTNQSRGVDPNRNYAGFWGGPGASTSLTSETYRGASAFSEPETKNIQALVSAHQVTTLITNHTCSNLVLREPGYASAPNTPDEAIYKALGDQMAAQNGYSSQFGYELYDTTGTTEDWSYHATGGLGFTFEHGASSFHPAFSNVVNFYFGSGSTAGKGNRRFICWQRRARSIRRGTR